MTKTRPITSYERRIISALVAGAEKSDQPRLLADVRQAVVRPLNKDGSILEFLYANYERPDRGQMPIGHEGVLLDADGAGVEVILYWDRNRRLCEFELVRIGEGRVLSPQWDSFRIKHAR